MAEAEVAENLLNIGFSLISGFSKIPLSVVKRVITGFAQHGNSIFVVFLESQDITFDEQDDWFFQIIWSNARKQAGVKLVQAN